MKNLLKLIQHHAIIHGDFTLRSGRKSTWYFDKYQLLTEPFLLHAIVEQFDEAMGDNEDDRVAGTELGGIPLATAFSLQTKLPALYVRDASKQHGTGNWFEGRWQPGDHVFLVEDVVTSGGAVLQAAQRLEEAKMCVTKIVALFDREEGGAETIANAGFTYEPLFKKRDLEQV